MIPEEALQILLDHLEECRIPFMITGSFASNVHGVPRVTEDADVIIETKLPALLRFVEGLGEEFYGDAEAAKDAFSTNRMLNIIHMHSRKMKYFLAMRGDSRVCLISTMIGGI